MNTLSDLIDDGSRDLGRRQLQPDRAGDPAAPRTAGQRPSPMPSPAERSLVTGPTSGLGSATARALAATGARVVLLGRDERPAAASSATELRCDARRRPVPDRRRGHGVADVGPGRRSSRSSPPRRAWTSWSTTPARCSRSAIEGPDGIEATVALMVVGPFVLIGGLLPLLERTEGSRVIAVTSGGMYTQPLDLDDLESRDEPYSGPRAYARAKRAQVDARCANGRGGSRRPVSRSAPCIRAGRTRPGWPSRSRGSTG